MSGESWLKGELLGFDTETTGVYDDDQIVTAALAHWRPDAGGMQSENMLMAKTKPSHPKAFEVHGINDDYAAVSGLEPTVFLESLCARLAEAMNRGVPIVGKNLTFDFTMLDRNCRHFGVRPLSERMSFEYGGDLYPVIDVEVLDYHFSPEIRGKGERQLVAICKIYGVPLSEEEAHNSLADTVASMRVLWRMANRFPEIASTDLKTLHRNQKGWYAVYKRKLFTYFERRGTEYVDNVEWPLRRWNAALPVDRETVPGLALEPLVTIQRSDQP